MPTTSSFFVCHRLGMIGILHWMNNVSIENVIASLLFLDDVMERPYTSMSILHKLFSGACVGLCRLWNSSVSLLHYVH